MQIKRFEQEDACKYECWDDYQCSVMASAVVRKHGRQVYLQDINVSSSYRGRGIGTGLLKQILADFEGTLIVASVFEARVPWYERHGFRPTSNEGNLVRIEKSP
ncbi:MAG: GNAT family N-acetyltransferase [Candidatus Hadarchaeaceae archaeon]|nr:GNAT family N-acetyltransferase [Hadesarchaea archaeon]MDH5684967.1 GNAT family N-acetyltransferase [Hadesarchaea archaeon]